MTAVSVYLGDAIFNWLKSTAFPADPAAVYAGLFDGDPQGAGVEVTQTISLTRQAITFGAIASRSMSNNAELDFGDASGAADVDYVSIHDASTGGNLLASAAVDTPASITGGEKVAIGAGDLDLTY